MTTLIVLSFLGGVLTTLSPCILPVLPFVLTRTGKPFWRHGFPMLTGLATAFASIATLAAVGGGWALQANQWGRRVALVIVLVLGLSLLLPRLAAWLSQPLVALGNRLGTPGGGGTASSLTLGVATGLLWAPCAGPILGLILTGAALRGPSASTSLLLFTYAAGCAVSLAIVLIAGGGLLARLKRALGVEEWLRRALGATVVAGALAIAFGLDTGWLARVSTASTTRLEQALLTRLPPERKAAESDLLLPGPAMSGSAMMSTAMSAGRPPAAPAELVLPPLDGATQWLNSEPLTREGLRGKVVVVDFWTYSCINCIRALPYVKAWDEKYRDRGLVVIGVHSPEFAFEKDVDNVRRAVRDAGISYPVAIDNDFALWRAFANEYWPAHYFIDATGKIRHMHFGEGEYDASERVIQELLDEAGLGPGAPGFVNPNARGAALASNALTVLSPETYVGHSRSERFASPGGQQRDIAQVYTLPPQLALNQWALEGEWTVGPEEAILSTAPGKIAFRFHARDLHLVLGANGPVRFRVRLDGAEPGDDGGADVDLAGGGTISGERLYQLIRQSGPVRDRVLEIEFLDPGATAYAFTFG